MAPPAGTGPAGAARPGPRVRLPRNLLIASMLLLASGTGLLWQAWPRRAAISVVPSHPALGRDLPPFLLTRHDGRPFTRDSLVSRWTLLFFGYTQCPDVCPTTLSAMREAMARLGNVPRPQVVFVSVDPQRDSIELLSEYMPRFDPAFVGASGPEAAWRPLAEALGVAYARHASASNYTIDHTASVFLIGPDGRTHAVFAHPPDAELVAQGYREAAGIR